MRTFILALTTIGALTLAGCGDATETGSVATDDPAAVGTEPLPGAQPETVDPAAIDPVAPADGTVVTE